MELAYRGSGIDLGAPNGRDVATHQATQDAGVECVGHFAPQCELGRVHLCGV